MLAVSDPLAPSLVWTYPRPVRALLVRVSANEVPAGGSTPWTDSAGVRAVEVIGLDAKPAEASRALVKWREGKRHTKRWVPLANIASKPADAAAKLAPHLSALLVAQRPHKMPVTTTASRAEASAS